MPIVIGYLPALGLSWIAGRGFHQGMTAICFAAAVLAFVPGFKKHGVLWPVLFGLLGIGTLAYEAFGFAGPCTLCGPDAACHIETASASFAHWLPPIGGLLLVTGHLLNHSYSCRCCQSGHTHPH